ncbi:MAG: HD domain-containing phosphohydrolase, partial [Candidatus Eremiobacterota bacterium]
MKELYVSMFDLIMCMSGAMDMINPSVVDHHKRVAYIAFCIGKEMGLSLEEQNELILAGLLHDSGALYLKERLATLEFEQENPYSHPERGYLLLKNFQPFHKIASLVRYHHTPWSNAINCDRDIPPGSHILNLADRISVLIDNKEKNILWKSKKIIEKINNFSELFNPYFLDIFNRLSDKESFWLDASSPSIGFILSIRTKLPSIELNLKELVNLGKLFCQIIDFRSHFTATHTSGVAATAECLARLSGFSERECHLMRLAGYLHDLGKLAVPAEILEKPGKLTEEEFGIIRSHTYYTYVTLEHVNEFDIINSWASFHHERLDGRGYPFRLNKQDLSIGSRIMSVADVFTALTEDRPYRTGMDSEKTMKTIRTMAENSALDKHI